VLDQDWQSRVFWVVAGLVMVALLMVLFLGY
jgi:hypothetical protein